MRSEQDLIARDLKHIWHPCAQMKDFEKVPPIVVYKAQGSYLETNHGRLIDGIASWWCKSLGHGHPEVIAAITDQLSRFEHIIGANTTHESLARLGELLFELTSKQHVFFASDGACAVEIAMKLALQACQLRGQPERNQFVALSNGYHGETFATLSVSDLGIYKKPFQQLNLNCTFLNDLPYVNQTTDPLWQSALQHWQQTKKQLDSLKDTLCAILVEPIVQGAGGMRIYSQDYLRRLALWAKEHQVLLIADEIMTGLGRTGKWLACDHANIRADLVCISKGLTSGSIPMSCVLLDDPLFRLFYNEDPGKSFLHSHTFSANPLGVAAAVATLNIMQRDGMNQQAILLGEEMHQAMLEVSNVTGKLSNVRSIGALVAAELQPHPDQRISQKIYQEALSRGALLRPIGNTIYWLPPLTMELALVSELAEITSNTIHAVYQS